MPRFMLLLLFVLFAPVRQDTITLSLGVPEFFETSLVTQRIMHEFEAAHPGIQVELRSTGNRFVPAPTSVENLTRYLDEMGQMASIADILMIDSTWLLPEATQTGMFLNLSPLSDQDTSVTDFVPAVWDSFRWQNGMWALPVAFRPVTLFLAEGIVPPKTLDELEITARALDERPAIGFTSPYALDALIRASLENDDPALRLNDPKVIEVITKLRQMEQDGLLTVPYTLSDFPETPIIICSGYWKPDREIAPLPGNQVGMTVAGFAVSGGTQHPEAAYALAAFLSHHPELDASIQAVPARQSFIQQPLPENLIPASQTHYFHYLHPVITNDTEPVDAMIAQIELALSQQEPQPVTVEIPAPKIRPTLAPGEIELHFGISSRLSPLPTRTEWERLAREYDAARVTINITFSPTLTDLAGVFDCFYMPSNIIPTADLSLLRNVDPLIDSDPAFNPDDFIGDVFAQVSRDGSVWGIPMTITPDVMWYNIADFEGAALPSPSEGWTVQDFTQVLSSFEDRVITPYVAERNTYLLLLIAAYGGLPIDYRTNPPTINFTVPETVDAIRQVLDLAKSGKIAYLTLSTYPPRSNSGATPLVLSPLDDSNSRSGRLVLMSGSGNYAIAPYPRGALYTPVAYDVGTGYISASTLHPETCYDFIRYIGQHPALFTSMPVMRSHLDQISRDQQTLVFYQTFAALLQDPQTISFPSSNNFSPTNAESYWLNLAFDQYVLEDADLLAELTDAETRTREFLACMDGKMITFEVFSQCKTQAES